MMQTWASLLRMGLTGCIRHFVRPSRRLSCLSEVRGTSGVASQIARSRLVDLLGHAALAFCIASGQGFPKQRDADSRVDPYSFLGRTPLLLGKETERRAKNEEHLKSKRNASLGGQGRDGIGRIGMGWDGGGSQRGDRRRRGLRLDLKSHLVWTNSCQNSKLWSPSKLQDR